MSALTHTRGPWALDESGNVRAKNFGQLAIIVTRDGDREESKANANLIAAAPGLLDALRNAVLLMDAITEAAPKPTPVRFLEELNSFRRAIAKAEGA